MTMREYQRFTLWLLGLLVLGLGAVAYGAPRHESVVAAHAHEAAATVESDEHPDVSLSDLDAKWLDQAGAARTLMGADDDRVAVITMLYTSCTVSCPRLVADLKRIEGALSAAERDHVEFVLVSLDPARDTPERLTRFATDLHLDASRWTLLTAEDAQVRELASVLRVRYLTDAAGEIMHTNRIVVANEDGAIVHWQEGVGAGVPATIDAIKRMREHGNH